MEDQTGMEIKYALYSDFTPTKGLKFKVYKVKNVQGRGSSIATATIVGPIIGSFFSIRKGVEERIPGGQIFDSVEDAVNHARKLVYSLKANDNPYEVDGVTPFRFFDALFRNNDNKKLLKMAENLTELEKEYEKWQRS